MKIKKNDKVLVMSGKDRGRKGKVLEAFPRQDKVVVEGINLIKKHVRPKKSGEKGQIVQLPAPIQVSNLKLICKNCGKPTRVEYKIIANIKNQPARPGSTKGIAGGKSKLRICKKCGKET